MWMANLAQQLISPVQISQITVLNGSNRLDVVNVPVGLNGFVARLHESGGGKLDRPMAPPFHQHQRDAVGFCHRFRAGRSWFYRLSFPVSVLEWP